MARGETSKGRQNHSQTMVGSELDCALIMNIIGQGIVVTGEGWRFEYVNPAFAKMLGLSPEDLIGRSIDDFIHPDDRQILRDSRERRLAGETTSYEVRLIRSDGQTIYVQVTGAPRWQDSKVIGAFTIIANLTERHKADQDIKNSEQWLANIINFLPDATFVIDKEGRIITWNKAMEKLTGIMAKDMLGKWNYEYALPFYGIRRPVLIDLVLKPEDLAEKEVIEKSYRNLQREDGTLVGEIYTPSFRSAGEAYLWGKASPLYDSEGHIIAAIESIRDITARRVAEKNLQASEARFREMAELLPDMVYEMNAELHLTYANKAAFRFFGYTNEELAKGINITQLLSGEEVDRARANLAIIASGQPPEHHTYKMRRKDGTIFFAEVISSPIRDANGNLIGFRGVVRDITESKKFEDALQESRDYLNKIINLISDPIFVKDEKHRLVLVNDAECNLVGRPREEILGKTDYDFFPKEQVDVFWEKDDDVFRTGKESVNEEQITASLGFTHTIVTKKALYEDKAGNKFIVGIISDITQRKKMEEELRRYSENLEMLIQESPTPTISANSEGRIVIINKSAETLLGYRPGELLGSLLSKILPPGQSLKVAEGKNHPMHFVNKMGADIPMAVSTSIHLFKDRKSGMREKGMIITLRDLSELQGLSISPRREVMVEAAAEVAKPLLEPGYIYLAEEEQPSESIAVFRQLVEHGAQGLVISRQRAEKIKSIYHLERTPHIWLTRNKIPEENSIGPDELSKLNKTVENFIKKAEQGILFFDGLEYLIAQNGFNTALKFLYSLNDVIMLCNSLAIWAIDPMALDIKELHTLRRETRGLQPILRVPDLSQRD